MDESLDYTNADPLRRVSAVSSQWLTDRNPDSECSLEEDTSNLFLQLKNYHLHLIQKKEFVSDRPTIPSTKLQRLSYYRNYAASPTKTQMVCMTTNSFNMIFWNYIFNTFLKSLPHTYVNIFLASYAPQDHLFLPKMVPFFYGFKFAFMISSVFEFITFIHNCVFNFAYLMHGFAQKSPWNRCSGKYTVDNYTITCLELNAFSVKVKNETWSLTDQFYVAGNGEPFQIVQLEHFRRFKNNLKPALQCVYFMIIWLTVTSLSHYAILQKGFWKVLNTLQIFIMILELVIFIYLLNAFFEEKPVPIVAAPSSELSIKLSRADINLVAESTTIPPVVHVLTARSTQIEPSRDSAIICLSNAAIYLFRALLTNRLRHHCMNLAGAHIPLDSFNSYGWFYFWPMFFSKFYLGDLYTLGYMTLNLIIDTLTLTVTYHCYMEAVTYEWKWLQRWMATCLTAITCFLCYLLIGVNVLTASLNFYHFVGKYESTRSCFNRPRFEYHLHKLLHIYTKVLATLCEIIALYCLYPLGRLVDDITFHFGTPPPTLRILCLKIMPLFYSIKFYILIYTLTSVLSLTKMNNYLQWPWTLTLVPYVLGMIFIACKCILKDKLGWQRMFVPDSNWGPQEQSIRKLRKEFDSRCFIKSQSDRNLSRYMMEKSESKVFQLDLNYNSKKRSTAATHIYVPVEKLIDHFM